MQNNQSHHKASDSPDTRVSYLVGNANDLLTATREWVNEAAHAKWHPSGIDSLSGYHLVLRAIVVKQFEALESVLALVADSRGFSATPLLRAMCEELIWVTYLGSRSEEESSRLIQALGLVGIYETFSAQENYPIPNTGFSLEWKLRSKSAHDRGRDELREFFSKKGFKLNQHQVQPSMAQLAKSVSMEPLYQFLYHATSRAVHFSVPELLRRIWGEPGHMTISSETFERYWAAFSVYWGSWLYSLTFLTVLPLLGAPDLLDEKIEQIGKAMEDMKKLGAIPILTNSEVYWPKDWA